MSHCREAGAIAYAHPTSKSKLSADPNLELGMVNCLTYSVGARSGDASIGAPGLQEGAISYFNI